MYPPLSELFDSVTCVSSFRQPRSRDEKAILEGISSVYRLFPLPPPPPTRSRKGQLPDSLSLSLFLCSIKIPKLIDRSR